MSTTLREWCDRYALRRGIVGQSAYCMVHTIDVYSQWLGRPALVDDLDEDRVSEWIAYLETPGSGFGPVTRCNLRNYVMLLWRFVAEQKGHRPPGAVRKAPRPDPQPVAWTLAELQLIRRAAMQARGHIVRTGTPRSLYLVTLIDAAYETGLRRGDLWRLTQEQFTSSGIVIIRQNKTQWPHEPQVTTATLQAIRNLPGDCPLRWPGATRCFYTIWHRWVIEPSGVRPGVLQQIRRTGATQLESLNPAHTSRYLGHKTADMKRHYVDRSQAYGPAPMPPRFWWEEHNPDNRSDSDDPRSNPRKD